MDLKKICIDIFMYLNVYALLKQNSNLASQERAVIYRIVSELFCKRFTHLDLKSLFKPLTLIQIA